VADGGNKPLAGKTTHCLLKPRSQLYVIVPVNFGSYAL